MKLLLISDLHYTLKQYDWIARVADKFDVVVIAGDHLDIASSVALDAQVVVILNYLRRLQGRSKLLVSSGNHDLTGRNAAGEKIAHWMRRVRNLNIPCDGDSVSIDDTLVSICPWWDGPETRKVVAAQLARDADKRLKKWVWIYHAPPSESPTSWTGKRHYGDSELRGWIGQYQPDMVLTGHIHQSPFTADGCWIDRIGTTWVLNPGRQIGPIPTHIICDTDANRAMWFSLAGNEEISLDRPFTAPMELRPH